MRLSHRWRRSPVLDRSGLGQGFQAGTRLQVLVQER